MVKRIMTNTQARLTSVVLTGILLLSALAVAPTFGAAQSGDAVKLQDGGTYWQGQDVYRSENISANAIVEVYSAKNDNLVKQYEADKNGVVQISLRDDLYSSGSYYLQNSNGKIVAVFDVAVQELFISAGSQTVTNAGADSQTTITIDSTRTDYDALVSVTGLNAAETAALFNNAETGDFDGDRGTEVRLNNLSSNAQFAADFEGVAAGKYEMTFEAVDTGATASVNITVKEEQPGTVTFEDSTVTEDIGDVAEITLNLENTDTAEVQIGSNDVGYSLNFSVTDGNGDGQVTVLFNSYLAGSGSSVVSAKDSEDSVTFQSENDRFVESAGELEPLQYGLQAFTGGQKTDVGVVSLSERETTELTTAIAPGGISLGPETIPERVTQRQKVAAGDYIIFKVEASGLEGYFNAEADLSDGAAQAENLGIYVTAEEAGADLNSQPEELNVGSPAEVVTDFQNDTLYLAYNVNNLNTETGEKYEFSFVIDENNPYVENKKATESVNGTFTQVERTVKFFESGAARSLARDDPVQLLNQQGQRVVARTTAAPGTEFTVTVESKTLSEPFLSTTSGVVTKDGLIIAQFDLGGISEGTELAVDVTGGVRASTTAEVTPPPRASVDAEDQQVINTVVLSSVTLNEAGEVRIISNNKTLGTKTLEAGNYTNVEVQISSLDAGAEIDAAVAVFPSSDASEPFKNKQGLPAATQITLSGPAPTYTVTLRAKSDDGMLLEGATFTVNGQKVEGELQLTEGTYNVTANAEGYKPVTRTITVTGDGLFTFTLAPENEPPSTVTSTPDATPATTTSTPDATPATTTSTPDATPATTTSTPDATPATTTSTPNTATTDEPTTDTETTTTNAVTGTTGTDTTSNSLPGFGIGIAVVALLGAALLAARRNKLS